MTTLNYGLHWFRRDLRVAGNPALRENFLRHQGRVLGLFCFDSKFLSRPDFSAPRFAFFMETMKVLKQELQAAGGDLLVIDALPQDVFSVLHKFLISAPQMVSFNRDYEPFARLRDQQVTQLIESLGIQVHTERDHLILEPHEVLKDQGFYQVYTPYSRRWAEAFAKADVQKRVDAKICGLDYLKKREAGQDTGVRFALQWNDVVKKDFPYQDALEQFQKKNQPRVSIALPEAGSLAAFRRLKKFKAQIESYKDDRDIPSLDGTSQMSMYLKNGSLTSAQVLSFLGLASENIKVENSRSRYLKEIIWREFYYSILWHCPRVENEAFLEKYKNLAWETNPEYFRRWCEGRTGYPIIDAGMRQLNTTGWMHNRVRMIVASFLTKDLLIDWRLGENYFMQKLLDGDLAPNNGGWQWAASTGCDPQPYFRVFNPYLQSEKFDPQGEYIRTYVPELRGLSAKDIHQPPPTKDYPEPIVDHATQKAKAIALYKNLKI